jgi:thiamine-phosphate pyrophosphorylase
LADRETAQIYLTTPPTIQNGQFSDALRAALDTVPVACMRLDLATRDADALSRAADLVREIAHGRDVAVVVAEHVGLVDRLGLDGVHLTDGARSVRKVRKDLGADRIVGSFCRASRHDAMTAGESGADYIAFGPVRPSGLGDGTIADRELFSWWSEMIEIPVVAEGVDVETARDLAAVTDFVVPDPEFWSFDDPASTLSKIAGALA